MSRDPSRFSGSREPSRFFGSVNGAALLGSDDGVAPLGSVEGSAHSLGLQSSLPAYRSVAGQSTLVRMTRYEFEAVDNDGDDGPVPSSGESTSIFF